jgi:hypothetical protein
MSSPQQSKTIDRIPSVLECVQVAAHNDQNDDNGGQRSLLEKHVFATENINVSNNTPHGTREYKASPAQ